MYALDLTDMCCRHWLVIYPVPTEALSSLNDFDTTTAATTTILLLFVWVYVSDLSDMRCRRRLVVYPLKMSELSHPTLMDAVGLATEFKTSYVKSRVSGSADTMSWIGYVPLLLLLLLLR